MEWVSVYDRMPRRVQDEDSDKNLCLAWWRSKEYSGPVIVSVNFKAAIDGNGYTHWMEIEEPSSI